MVRQAHHERNRLIKILPFALSEVSPASRGMALPRNGYYWHCLMTFRQFTSHCSNFHKIASVARMEPHCGAIRDEHGTVSY